MDGILITYQINPSFASWKDAPWWKFRDCGECILRSWLRWLWFPAAGLGRRFHMCLGESKRWRSRGGHGAVGGMSSHCLREEELMGGGWYIVSFFAILREKRGGLCSYGSRNPWRVILRDEEAQRNPMSDRDMRVKRREMMKVYMYMYIVQLNISKIQNSLVFTRT